MLFFVLLFAITAVISAKLPECPEHSPYGYGYHTDCRPRSFPPPGTHHTECCCNCVPPRGECPCPINPTQISTTTQKPVELPYCPDPPIKFGVGPVCRPNPNVTSTTLAPQTSECCCDCNPPRISKGICECPLETLPPTSTTSNPSTVELPLCPDPPLPSKDGVGPECRPRPTTVASTTSNAPECCCDCNPPRTIINGIASSCPLETVATLKPTTTTELPLCPVNHNGYGAPPSYPCRPRLIPCSKFKNAPPGFRIGVVCDPNA